VAHELDREFAVYRRELPTMLTDHEGQWVLIHGDDVAGFWPTEDEAYDAGCDRFGPGPFLVMPVVKDEPPEPFLYPVEANAPPDHAP
jgi:hypothetical protein